MDSTIQKFFKWHFLFINPWKGLSGKAFGAVLLIIYSLPRNMTDSPNKTEAELLIKLFIKLLISVK